MQSTFVIRKTEQPQSCALLLCYRGCMHVMAGLHARAHWYTCIYHAPSRVSSRFEFQTGLKYIFEHWSKPCLFGLELRKFALRAEITMTRSSHFLSPNRQGSKMQFSYQNQQRDQRLQKSDIQIHFSVSKINRIILYTYIFFLLSILV